MELLLDCSLWQQEDTLHRPGPAGPRAGARLYELLTPTRGL